MGDSLFFVSLAIMLLFVICCFISKYQSDLNEPPVTMYPVQGSNGFETYRTYYPSTNSDTMPHPNQGYCSLAGTLGGNPLFTNQYSTNPMHPVPLRHSARLNTPSFPVPTAMPVGTDCIRRARSLSPLGLPRYHINRVSSPPRYSLEVQRPPSYKTTHSSLRE